MRERFGSCRWVLACGLMGTTLVLGTGCPGLTTSGVNAALKQLLADLQLASGVESIIIRVVNGSDELTEEIDLRIDGFIQTFTCEAQDQTCNFDLGYLPIRVEAVEERRLDEDDEYEGGRIFGEQDGFIFTRDDFQAGSVIVFQLSEDDAQAFVL